MANKLHRGPLLPRQSHNKKRSNFYHHRRSSFPSMKEFIDISNRHIKNHGYKLLVVVMLATLCVVIVPSLLGCRFESIRSSSMSPALDTGGLVITRPVNPYSIKIGDIIAYYPPSTPDTLVVHRVAGIDNGSPLSFLTKGDANKSLDAYLLPAEAVVGQGKFYVPWAGYLVGFAKSFLGFVILLAIPGTIILYLELNKLWTLLSTKIKKRTARPRRRRDTYAYSWRISI